MKRTAGSPPRRRRLFGAGSTATRDSPDARTSSSRHAPSFAFTSSKTRRCTQPSRRGLRVPGGAGVSGRVAETAVGDAASGDEHNLTISAAINYASSLNNLRRFKEAKSLLEKTTPLTRRILGESHEITLKMRLNYAEALYADDDATLDDLRKAVTTLEDAGRTARRVFGSTHPLTEGIEDELQKSRAALGGSSKGSN